MDDRKHQPRPDEGASRRALAPGEEPLPWEGDPPLEEEHGPDGRRVRHDAFTARRKHDFLRALAKTGCLADACRITGVPARTVYRHQEKDAAFAEHCRLAMRMSAVPIELTAWARAVEGVEQEFACGGQIHVRRRYDAGLLRLLLQGSNPKKYGPRPGFSRKRLLRHERKQIERQVRAEMAPEPGAREKALESIRRKIEAIERHAEPGKLAAGWTRTPDGHWVPPGYAPILGWTPPPPAQAEGDGGGDPR